MEDSWEDRQRNEIQALQAIYSEDFEAVILSADSEDWKEPEFILHLKPTRGFSDVGKAHVKLDMRVRFSCEYPTVSPVTALEKSEGLSQKELEELEKEVHELCARNSGQEIVFNLADYIQNRLSQMNRPQFGSFYDEMVFRQQNKIEEVALQEKHNLEKRQQEDQSIMQAIEEEILKKKEALRNELVRNKELSVGKPLWKKPEFVHKNRTHKESVSSEDENRVTVDECCFHSGNEFISFSNKDQGRTYKRVRCLGKCTAVRSVFSAVEANLSEMAVVFRYSLGNVRDEGQPKQLNLLEQEFRALQRIRHKTLVPYIAFKAETLENEASVLVSQEFVPGINLSYYLKNSIPVNVDFLRHVTCGLLEGLAALHAANVVFKNLRDSNVIITNDRQILLASFSFESRLCEMLNLKVEKSPDRTFPPVPGRGSKKGDIHRLGILLWSLFQGKIVSSYEGWKLPSRMPPVLQEFISKCIVEDERHRPNALDLQEHSFLKTPITRPLLEREESTNPTSLPMPSSFLGTSATSRLQNEFEVLTFLGSGGFGDVLKARNKLDGNIYAIKKIRLDAKSKQLYKKITREVKLLSRLNHENVVRYYNSWIETTQSQQTKPKRSSLSSTKEDSSSDGSSSSSLESPNQAWFVKPQSRDSSDGIEFEEDDDDEDMSQESSSTEEDDENEEETTGSKFLRSQEQHMYIQMEYCEKSTLRTAIDAELYKDKTRIWRLFREIIEGLAHIHQQGIIHRDLKPVNIFLDVNDHVKIGDFGLATSIVIMQKAVDVTDSSITDRSADAASSSGALTGDIGTALYIAPELKMTGKLSYNEKVDIYSVGIIFFEMSYPPFPTGMERFKILSGIRQPDVTLPSNAGDFFSAGQSHVIRWLLNHNPGLRPTSQELLQSELLPPPQLEDAELQEMVRHTMMNPQSKAYKYLIASCFQQQMTLAQDVTYDLDLSVPSNATVAHRTALMYHSIAEIIAKHCQKKGAIPFTTPLLCPKAKGKGGPTAGGRAYLMAHSGAVLSLPFDLQTPFARHIARSNITWLKRYSVEKVYSERKIFWFHPKESIEAAFDIVTPAPGPPLSDSEVLVTVSEVLQDPRLLSGRLLTLYVNHAALVRALLVHCGIPEEKQPDVSAILHSLKLNRNLESQTYNRLAKLAVPRQAAETLISFLDVQGPLAKISGSLKSVTTRKGEAASLAKQALHELEAILGHAEALGLRCTPLLSLGLINPGQTGKDQVTYSGLMFQFVYESQQRRLQKKKSTEVLARGGRYDGLVASFRSRLPASVEPTGLAVVGALIAVDKLLLAMEEAKVVECATAADVAVFAIGHQPLSREKASLLKELWSLGVKAVAVDHLHTVEEAQSWCREKEIPNIVFLKDTESGTVRLRTWEKDRYNERRISVAELLDTLQRALKSNGEMVDARPENYGRSSSISEVTTTSTGAALLGASSGVPVPSLIFVTEEKLSMSARKRYESQVLKTLQPVLQHFNSRSQIDIVAIETSGGVVSAVAAALISTNNDPRAIEEATLSLIDKHRRQRKYLERVMDQVFRMRFEKNVSILIVYGLHDNSHRTVM